MITIDTGNRISIDGRQTGLAVVQHQGRTVVYTPEDTGGGYAEKAMPHARYALAHDAPASGVPGRAQFEADLRALHRPGGRPMNPRTLVVTRHAGAAAWLAAQGLYEAVPHLDAAELAALGPDDTLVGVLPLHIVLQAARQGVRVGVLVLPELRPEERGAELTPAQMTARGARILWITGIALIPGGGHTSPKTSLTVEGL